MTSEQKQDYYLLRSAGLHHRAMTIRERLRLNLISSGMKKNRAAVESWQQMLAVLLPEARRILEADGSLLPDGTVRRMPPTC